MMMTATPAAAVKPNAVALRFRYQNLNSLPKRG
jgi:hypothetical protein